MTKVWYKNTGDANPTYFDEEESTSVRPDEKFFLSAVPQEKRTDIYTIVWNGGVPVLERNANAEQEIAARFRGVVCEKIDIKTDELIKLGWIYPDINGQQIRLTGIDQANYEGEKNLYTELDSDGVDVTSFFPLDVKVWTGPSGEPIMLAMADLAAYKTFIRTGKGHIRTKLQEGWLLKGDLIAMNLEELKAWEDLR